MKGQNRRISDATGVADFAPQNRQSSAGVEALLRSATPSDGAAVLEIISLITAEGFYFVSEPDEINTTVEQAESWIADHLSQPGNLILVAEVGGRVVAFIEFERGNRRRVAHMGQMSIYVRQECRGLGIGSLLLQALLGWASASPAIEKVCLAVFASNHRALGFYHKHGFCWEGTKPREFKLADGTYDDEVMMSLFVGRGSGTAMRT